MCAMRSSRDLPNVLVVEGSLGTCTTGMKSMLRFTHPSAMPSEGVVTGRVPALLARSGEYTSTSDSRSAVS